MKINLCMKCQEEDLEYVINNIYKKDDVNKTFYYQFHVPKEIEKIEVFIEVKQPPKPINLKDRRGDFIGIGIKDKSRIRSWNCCHRMYLSLSEYYGTPGSIPGRIEEGEWELVIFPRTKSEIICTEVNVRIVLTSKRWRFVKGDLHMHTVHSDGKMSIEESAKLSKNIGLEYIFITDHNISSANYSLPKDQDIFIGDGIEYGVEQGHMNILGDKTPVNDFTWEPDFSSTYSVIDDLHRRRENDHIPLGMGINHPFCDDSPWKKGMMVNVDWIEVWNGLWRPTNERAIKWWQEQLIKGRRIPVVGGSDSHNDSIGIPTTHAYVYEINTEQLIQAFRRGWCYITNAPIAPKILMTTEHNIMGDLTSDSEVIIELANLTTKDKIHIITDVETVVVDVEEADFSYNFTRKTEKFIRVEVLRKNINKCHINITNECTWKTVLISNPIYFL